MTALGALECIQTNVPIAYRKGLDRWRQRLSVAEKDLATATAFTCRLEQSS
jgi:hypothetical protein